MSEPTHNSLRDLRKGSKGASKGWQGPKVGWSGARKQSEEPARTASPSTSERPDYAYTPAYVQPVQQQPAPASSHNSRPRPAPSSSTHSALSTTSSTKPTTSSSGSKDGWFSWASGSGSQEKKMPPRPGGRYIPPSEREPGQAGFVIKKKQTGGTHGRLARGSVEDDDEPDEDDNSWAGWAAKQQRQAAAVLGGAAESVGQTVQSGWDTVNDAHRRDQVVGGIGSGAAKVAGGAVKYSAKGVWAVGKAAFR